MSFEQAVELLRVLRQRSLRNVVLGGGEPFLWPHGLERLTGVAKRLGFLVQVCTNGVAVPAGFESIPTVDRYLLPVESADPRRHDALRRLRGHHRIVVDRIRALAGSGCQLTVSTVVTRENIDELQAIADCLLDVRDSGVALHAWHLYRFVPVGRGGARHRARLGVTRPAFLRACASARRRAAGVTVFRRDNMLRSSAVEFFWFERGTLQVGSHALRAVSAAPDGTG